jgi:cystathionine beta-synthase
MHTSLMKAIGNTPLVQVNFDTPTTIYAKLEYLNPGGSIKDRSAYYMIEQAEKNGDLKPGWTIIDASSGNHGIAIAMVGAAKDYPVIITVSEKISQEKLNTLKAYGAHIVTCPATQFIEDPQSYHSQAVQLHKKNPQSFMPNQYFNTVNTEAHYYSLGPEIWQQTNGAVTHFFAGAGTGGTISGAGRYLKEKNPAINVIAVDSVNSFRSTNGNPKPYQVEGMGIDFDSSVIDYNVIDAIITVSDDQALGILKPLAQKHGLLVGPSSGAVAWAAKEYTKNCNTNTLAVMIFGDSGRAYLTKNFY